MHFFTSITLNYLPKARVLANSVKRYCKDSVFHLVICDNLPEEFDISEEPFDKVLTVRDLDIPVENLDMWIFLHSVVELCTAVKGQAIVKIIELERAEKVVYLDPDIAVFSDLVELENLLDKHDVVITPHQVEPENDKQAVIDNEICSLKHGIYNLGFLAVKNSEKGIRFAKWWRDRLVEFCFDDIPQGLFTDQRWIDLAPALFDSIYILRDKTYNVATWNISTRTVEKKEDKYFIDDSPLKFYHFSGFDSGAQELMLKRYGVGKRALFDLREWYIEQQRNAGQEYYGKKPSFYSVFSNGELISKHHRYTMRSRLDLQTFFKDTNPLIVTDSYICYYHWYQNEYKDKKIDEKDIQIEEMKRELESIRNSKSWRITAPLRYFMSLFRR